MAELRFCDDVFGEPVKCCRSKSNNLNKFDFQIKYPFVCA